MKKVINETGGTARLGIDSVSICGKTGTVQNLTEKIAGLLHLHQLKNQKSQLLYL